MCFIYLKINSVYLPHINQLIFVLVIVFPGKEKLDLKTFLK
jgi:hypothetical protein